METFEFGKRRFEAVAIGASAGGIEALLKLFQGLPAEYALPIVVVLHLPDSRDSRLAELLNQKLDVSVSEAQDKESVAASHIYIAPPGYHLAIEADRVFSLSNEEPVNFSRPSIDVLMESAADAYGEGLLGILLTGSNYDGAAGMQAIKTCGGITIAQDPREAVVATMPQAAIDRGAADHILTLDQIHRALLQCGTAV